MTRVCLLGEEGTSLQYELLSRETARDALAAYDLREPFANALAVETVSLGAAVALLNDLEWYLTRFVEEAFVLEPSISDSEWLSRELATAVRNDVVDPDDTGRFLRIYGVLRDDAAGEAGADSGPGPDGESNSDGETQTSGDRTPPRLVEPMLVARTSGGTPTYDLRDVDDTLVVRVTDAEFEA